MRTHSCINSYERCTFSDQSPMINVIVFFRRFRVEKEVMKTLVLELVSRQLVKAVGSVPGNESNWTLCWVLFLANPFYFNWFGYYRTLSSISVLDAYFSLSFRWGECIFFPPFTLSKKHTGKMRLKLAWSWYILWLREARAKPRESIRDLPLCGSWLSSFFAWPHSCPLFCPLVSCADLCV